MSKGRIESHRDLRVYREAYAMGLLVYRLTGAFPAEERFGLTVQIRRSAVSVASNIAEGYGRGTTKDYLRFLRVARGSLLELDTQASFARDLGFLSEAGHQELQRLIGDCGRMLNGLIESIERSSRD